MKKISLLFCLLAAVVSVSAQKSEEEGHGFKKENLFTGGSLALGLGNGTTSFGIQPYFGYSVNRFLDVAVALNYDYVSERQYAFDNSGNVYFVGKYRSNVIGPGAFVRVFPVRFLYAQAQYEQNYITKKYVPSSTSSFAAEKQTYNVGSFLVGAGLATGRSEGNKSYGYISILFDVAKNINSPYLDGYGNINPVIRAGYNFALFQGREDKRHSRRSNQRD